MNILHIANFDGNVGDVANHAGFHDSFRRHLTPDARFSTINMREFYASWGLRKFDERLLELANTFDLLVLGGGGFFEPSVEQSGTGVTLDLSDDFLRGLRIPVLFNGLGVGDAANPPPHLVDRFRRFLDTITSLPTAFVSVRNDGSLDWLSDHVGDAISSRILEVPDSGYFVQPVDCGHPELGENAPTIGISLAGDALHARFPNGDSKKFITDIAEVCNHVLRQNAALRLVFVPHIAADLGLIAPVLDGILDRFVRQRITVAPLLNGETTNGLHTFDLYRRCSLILGMRHHACICGVSMGIPTIGLLTLRTLEQDFRWMEISHRAIAANHSALAMQVTRAIDEAQSHPNIFLCEIERVKEKVSRCNKRYYDRLRDWLHERRRPAGR